MITDYDRKLLTEAGKEYLLDITMESKILKEKLTFKEHVALCGQIKKLTYEEVITLLVTESIRDFESKFGKFLKYSIAAIAGLPGGLFGPPITMFILYLYRKATDTCVRSCFAKLPLSNERKVCKYECQLNAAKKMENDIHSQISKCSNFQKSDKCEKSLQKEYIKWAKRVQLLTVKVNRAKLDSEEKLRKQRQKELVKRAKTLRASVDFSKNGVLNFVIENEELRKRLNFKDHLKLYEVCKYIQEDEDDVQHIKIDPQKEKMIRTFMYLGIWAVPIPFFNDLVNYMVKKYSIGCAGKCLKNKKLPHSVCYSQCAYLGAKWASETLNKQLPKCNKAKDPIKCKKKVYKMLEDWKQREAERKIKFESALKSSIKKAKTKNLQQG